MENSVLDQLPKHLKAFVVDQNHNQYTAQDHAVWRYVMRQNRHFLKDIAFPGYIEGLLKTGIETDTIPDMYGMNRILKDIGWAAVAVDGFIPPSVFMEFQAHKVLVIAADIRTIEHLRYTPAPDIIHEAAGHAPFIANPEYAEYLIEFGKIGSRAQSSSQDFQLYTAIRHLSILKEDAHVAEKEIRAAEKRVARVQKNMGAPSEMALLRNLHWWTVEYGLIGTIENPKIYGAGLLSSISESRNCLKSDIEKIPYSIEAMHTNFDITKPQPQLFVTPDFKFLNTVLAEFAETMVLTKNNKCFLPAAESKPQNERFVAKEKTHKVHHNEKSKVLHSYYEALRIFRKQKDTTQLQSLAEKVLLHFPEDWLLPLEILEFAVQEKVSPGLSALLAQHLQKQTKQNQEVAILIQQGLKLIYNNFDQH